MKTFCQAIKRCVGFNWKNKKNKCILVKSYEKLSKKEKNTAGVLDRNGTAVPKEAIFYIPWPGLIL